VRLKIQISTGDIEILVSELTILNAALTPPFTIEDETVVEKTSE
jgi:aspartyl-tRNA synthetase